MQMTFDKYKLYGAYHFRAFYPWPRKDVQSYLRYKTATKVIEMYLRRWQRFFLLLDIGCGDGALEYYFVKHCKSLKHIHAICLDNNLLALRMAQVALRRISSFEFVLADTNHLPFRSNSFNIIIALEVIEHLSDPFTFMNNIYRCSKDSGLIVLSTPNALHIGNRDPYHVIEYTAKALQKLFVRRFAYCRIFGVGILNLMNIRILVTRSVKREISRIYRSLSKILVIFLTKILDLMDYLISTHIRDPNKASTLFIICLKSSAQLKTQAK